MSWNLSMKIDGGLGKIRVKNSKSDIIIIKGKNAKLILDGNLTINSHLYGSSPIRILLSDNSTLHIKSDFEIGNGVCLSIYNSGKLIIGGKKNESKSGITADTCIMVYSNIEIGYDFICSWGVFISDSNWHHMDGQVHFGNVIIGNHVWIANSSNILKNTFIEDNCIVASNSKLINNVYKADSIVAGIPAKVVKSGVSWKRDF